MEKMENMQEEATSLLTVWFGPTGKIKRKYVNAEYVVIPRKQYAAPNLRDKP